jgi:hypothetical protein
MTPLSPLRKASSSVCLLPTTVGPKYAQLANTNQADEATDCKAPDHGAGVTYRAPIIEEKPNVDDMGEETRDKRRTEQRGESSANRWSDLILRRHRSGSSVTSM